MGRLTRLHFLSTVTPSFAPSHGHSLHLVSSSSWLITPSSPTPPLTLLMQTRTLEVSSGGHKIQTPLKTLATPQLHLSSHSSPEASLVLLLLLLLLLVVREVGYLAPIQMPIPATPATPTPEEEAYLGSVQIRTPIPATPSNNKERLEQQQEAALYSPIRSANNNNNNNNPSSNPSSSNRNR